MIIGSCAVELYLYDSNSLKEKRHIIKSIIERIKNRFNVSIAEVDYNDVWNKSTIGFSCVSNNTSHCNKIISNVLNFVEGDGRVEIINANTEIF